MSEYAINTDTQDEKRGGKHVMGQIHKFLVIAVFLLTFSFLGGMADRIRGGYLNFPDFPTTNEPTAINIIAHNLVKRAIWALPLGLLVGLSMSRPQADPYFFVRTSAGVFVFLASLLSIYVHWSTYEDMGRYEKSYRNEVGVFDWLIGHSCQDWDIYRRWSHDFMGMSLRGLVQTVPAGLLLFHLGYGPEYMFSGLLMGLAYEFGHQLPAPFFDMQVGTDFAAFLWGTYTWLVLMSVVMAFRGDPRHEFRKAVEGGTIGRRIVWCIALALIGTIFVGSLIAYMHVKQKDEIAMAQNFLGLLATTVMVVAQLLVYLVLLPIIKRCRDNRMPEFYHQLPHEEGSGLHPELAAVVEDEIITAKPRPKLSSRFARWLHDFFLPKGEQPYRSFVFVIRLINMVAIAVLLPFLVYNVITGRIMAPCEIPWDSS